ncbi:MAG: hypothetical protein IJK14_00545 [Clostridia bacterium]|nr:hypothetical protein [Clostridia bacterium]MBR0443850.1 hypothetical protein [Clostridia bacterium]
MEQQPTNKNSVSVFLKSYWKLIVGVFLLIAGSDGNSLFLLAGVVLLILFFADLRKKAKPGQQQGQPEETPAQSAPSVGHLFSGAPVKPEDDREEWVCERCGATNRGSVCEYCDTPREEKAD